MKWLLNIALFFCEMALFSAQPKAAVQFSQDLQEEEEELIVFEESELEEDEF